jgi:hypothetical protein
VTAPKLAASVDWKTHEVYVPPRRFAADGSLRPCEPGGIPSDGTLRAFTSVRGIFYGLVDLASAVRVQVRLDVGPHEVGAIYQALPAAGNATTVALAEAVFSRA